ncbi:carbamoyl-phosphate synthase small subunit [Halobellus salinus]|uniref:Carbamoyl phosphate synthase small chain n=1 Tax=Halobellus salinus TaxID=931585 RepID=A0A830EDC7_9EURY|nr:glutamine-hydrolyzing carbamoyl-phosphate synthase small subunit [Halobellus salinus]GGJ14643.1 carbamoyl-phosphate synthase small subunit [Halobellus salinus]SMP15419.1 carbamoyl-phosphate synthase small subunit [Halobellus salinus]
MSDAYLALEDGRVIEARGRAPGRTRGELVFTTAYTGYEESLTDPSYEEQVLTFSYPLIGNYGVRDERFESDRVHPRAAIAHEFTEDVAEWLDAGDVPAIDHIDTRELVTSIREGGAMKCGIAVGDGATPEDAKAELSECRGMSEHVDIGKRVTTVDHTTYGGGDTDVALIDCGAKMSIVESLVDRDATVHVLPYDTTPGEIAALDPDLLFISNGPGDPANFEAAETLVDEYVGDLPIAGICLGQQVVARALGGTTEKMAFGHRGVNQPVRDLDSGQVVMTTQNHGYTVGEPGDELDVKQVNVNDGTAEGLANEDLDVLTRQYHPEAHPGPHDSLGFFDDVLALTAENRNVVADD